MIVHLRAVFFDVGETLVDERGYWERVAAVAGVPAHALLAALGVTIARSEDHRELWHHLGVERPATVDDVVYETLELYPDARACLEAVRGLGRRAHVFQADVSDPSQCRQVVAEAVTALGRLDVLVNMASIYVRREYDSLTDDDWNRQLAVDHLLQRSPAHRTERHLVPGEHDAVHLRPVIPLRLVVGALEGADRVGVRR